MLTAARATVRAALVAQRYIVAAAYYLAQLLFPFCLHILECLQVYQMMGWVIVVYYHLRDYTLYSVETQDTLDGLPSCRGQ